MDPHVSTEGRLFTYGDDPMRRMSVFITGQKKRVIVVVGGQSDGLFSLLFIRSLIARADSIGWSVAQVQLASSCWGYGGRSHHGDSEDLDQLLQILNEKYEMHEVCLLAWGTGVQIALEVLAKPIGELVTRVIFHGVVQNPSDPYFNRESQRKRIAAALEIVDSGRRDDLVESLYDLPISAARLSTGGFPTVQEAFWQPALVGDQDRLSCVFSALRQPLLLLVACHPEYHPSDETRQAFSQSIGTAASDGSVEYFDDTCDERRRMLRGTESKHVAAIVHFLEDQDAKREAREQQSRLDAAESLRRQRSILARAVF